MYGDEISNACFVINASFVSDGNCVVDSENVWCGKAGLSKDTRSSACYTLNIRDTLAGNLSWPSDKRIMQEARKDVPNSHKRFVNRCGYAEI